MTKRRNTAPGFNTLDPEFFIQLLILLIIGEVFMGKLVLVEIELLRGNFLSGETIMDLDWIKIEILKNHHLQMSAFLLFYICS